MVVGKPSTPYNSFLVYVYGKVPHCEYHKRDEVAIEGDILLYLPFHPENATYIIHNIIERKLL